MFGVAVRSGALEANPMREVEGISGGGSGARALSAIELRRFLALVQQDAWAREHDLTDLIMFSAAIGCRIGESCAVRWEDVDLETGTVESRARSSACTARGCDARAPPRRARTLSRWLWRLPWWGSAARIGDI